MDVIDGRFEVLELVASGGMATVYRACDRVTGQDVALKVLNSQTDLERFIRETETLARLSHPGIVQYVGHGYMPGGNPYLVQEWLDGGTLRQKLDSDGLTPDQSVSAMRRVAEALAHAHENGIIHRDIKPENLSMVDGELDRIKVLDFGIARHDDNQITQTGTIIGTPAYMAPEQARGSRDIDARVDLFALGCVLYVCLSGRHAFPGSNPVVVRFKVIKCQPRPLALHCPEAPPELIELVERMMAREPHDRPSSAAEVADALGQIPRIGSSQARPLGYDELPTNVTGDITAPDDTLCMAMVATVEEQPMAEIVKEWKRQADAEGLLQDVDIQELDSKCLCLRCSSAQPAPVKATITARCAELLWALLPQAVINMATGTSKHEATIVGYLKDAVNRGRKDNIFAHLKGSSPRLNRIRIDKATAMCLGDAFEIEEDGATLWMLVPLRPIET